MLGMTIRELHSLLLDGEVELQSVEDGRCKISLQSYATLPIEVQAAWRSFTAAINTATMEQKIR